MSAQKAKRQLAQHREEDQDIEKERREGDNKTGKGDRSKTNSEAAET